LGSCNKKRWKETAGRTNREVDDILWREEKRKGKHKGKHVMN